ncbi:MAG: hypothetical protein ACOZBH_04950 [Patescibacteria group bacterium]
MKKSAKPKIKFQISARSDIENAKWFIKNGEFVDLFLPKEILFINDKKFSLKEKHLIISKYAKNFYQANAQAIARGVEQTKQRWGKIENKFFNLVNKIFGNHPWPKGKYIGYASIFNMFPRDIKDKIFYFPYSRKKFDPLSTVGHEMLHFIFYDFIEKNYGIKERDKFKGKSPKYLWQVAETFNTVIENWQPYKAIFKAKNNIKPYAGCEKLYQAMAKEWKKNECIDGLIKKFLGKKHK